MDPGKPAVHSITVVVTGESPLQEDPPNAPVGTILMNCDNHFISGCSDGGIYQQIAPAVSLEQGHLAPAKNHCQSNK
ncbi:MAG TPA: hypothetical protein VFW11_02535 [Cyclobacteriaceae bacterium]|nr:hypothetical protein [Cyclobacteriaceae bacterium]